MHICQILSPSLAQPGTMLGTQSLEEENTVSPRGTSNSDGRHLGSGEAKAQHSMLRHHIHKAGSQGPKKSSRPCTYHGA